MMAVRSHSPVDAQMIYNDGKQFLTRKHYSKALGKVISQSIGFQFLKKVEIQLGN